MTDEGGGRRQDCEYQGPKPHKAEARPRNWAQPVILVLLREWNSYGYEMMERMAEFGFEAMNPGTLYRTLRHMEKNGAVKSTWDASKGGPPRRMYSITNAGGLPRLLGQVPGAVPTQRGRLLRALYRQAATG